VAARALGAPDTAEGAMRDAAWAAALARFLVRACRSWRAGAASRYVDGRPEGVSALAGG
jgi:hypothetical protein